MGHFITDRLHSKGDGSAFYPYGESKTGAAGDDREQFATYTRDQTSGLDYADQRWYSSRLGRFLTVDPAADGNNHYSYSSSDPVNSYDPNGLLTVIVSGTSEQNAEWSRPGSEMYGLIQEHFQETPGCVFVFDWSDSIRGTVFGSAMEGAARDLADFIDRQYSSNPHCGGTPLNLVGYSHGGNVSLVYTHLPGSRIVENLVTLGTPSRLDIAVNSRNVVNFCAVSRSDDLVQFVGAHPLQVGEAIYAGILSARLSRRGVEALLRGEFQLARYYFELAAAAAAWSAAWILDTRVQPGARNFIIGGGPGMSREAHTAVRSPDAWRQVVSHPNWNCR
jgi:RHS repeat-associated protein